jgi:hypothetical protein
MQKNKYFSISFIISVVVVYLACTSSDKHFYQEALQNGYVANKGFENCEKFLLAWMVEADSATGLIPRNLNESRDFWNAWDAAADNYPFMVITSSILRPDLFKGAILNMLHTERKLTSRMGHLPDTYSFLKQNFLKNQSDTGDIIFGSAEYMKDGLLALTEWLGKSPWSERMIEILDDLDNELHLTPEMVYNYFPYIQAVEVNGDLLQVLSRMYWMTGNRKYLERAIQIGDFYLNEQNLPTRNNKGLRLRDHGCEIIGGLSEIYATVHSTNRKKREQWYPYIHEMLDCVLAKGRNEDGLFYNSINPVSGEILNKGLADTWGYTYDALYTVYLLDGTEAYKVAVSKALLSIGKYKNYDWENGSADGYADAIESAVNLFHFNPVSEVPPWLDSEIQVMWNKQKLSGIIEGWHGDGNFARTTLMYCLWKTAGTTLSEWDKDAIWGAVVSDGKLHVAITSSKNWEGALKFGGFLHQTNLNLPMNYPRINQFQEWYPIDPGKLYQVTNVQTNHKEEVTGKKLIEGYRVSILENQPVFLCVKEK